MDIPVSAPVSAAAAGRKSPRNQSLRAARLSREARKKFLWASAAVAFGLISIVGAEMLIQINRNKLNLEQAIEKRHTGRFTRPLADGIHCNNQVFDNKTDFLIEETVSRCVPERKRKGQTQFIWGGTKSSAPDSVAPK
jgi:hypothetical protein